MSQLIWFDLDGIFKFLGSYCFQELNCFHKATSVNLLLGSVSFSFPLLPEK
jgi:hypothetical protein